MYSYIMASTGNTSTPLSILPMPIAPAPPSNHSNRPNNNNTNTTATTTTSRITSVTVDTKCYVVKRCQRLKTPAIFWTWEDASFYVDQRLNPQRPAEYQVFETLVSALEYLLGETYKTLLEDAKNMKSKKRKQPPGPYSAAFPSGLGFAAIAPNPTPSGNKGDTTTTGIARADIREKRFKAGLSKLIQYKEKFGEFHVKKDTNEPLSNIASWYIRKRREVRKYQADPSTSTLTTQEFEALESVGFVRELDGGKVTATAVANKPTANAHIRKWGENFEKVKQFYSQHRRLPTQIEDRSLNRWISLQRRKITSSVENNGEISKVISQQIIKLTSVGVQFRSQNKIDMNTRCEEWLKFRQVNGTNPPGKSELGRWANKTITKYRNLKTGQQKRCNLTPEMIDRLIAGGFVFPNDDNIKAHLEKQEQETPQKRMSWEDSFEKLIEFQNIHGHTSVSQREHHLGGWVKEQRKQYTKLQRGEKTTLTKERLSKLVTIGFLFSAKSWREQRRAATRHHCEEAEDSDDDDGDLKDEEEDTGRAQSHHNLNPSIYRPSQNRSFHHETQHTITGVTQEPAGLHSYLRPQYNRGRGT